MPWFTALWARLGMGRRPHIPAPAQPTPPAITHPQPPGDPPPPASALLAEAAVDPTPAARELLRRGQTVEAERLLLDHVRRIEATSGTQHPHYATAQFQLASVRLAISDVTGAIAALRLASAVPGVDQPSRRNQITYGWNLGQILARGKHLDEALAVLRANLDQRLAFYGRSHAGYAFGLVSLAEVMWIHHQSTEALPLAAEAFETLARHQQLERWEAAALLGLIRCDLSEPVADPFQEALAATGDPAQRVLAKIQELSACRPAAEILPAAVAYRDLQLAAGPDHLPQADHAQSLVCRLATAANRQDLRLQAASWLVEHHQSPTDVAVDARVGMADVYQAMGDRATSLTWHDQACAMALCVSGPIASHTLRNAGLAYRDAGHHARGVDLLRQALALARERQWPEAVGRSCIALGVTLQHAKQVDEPRALLSEGVAVLPLLDRDMLCGYSHLRAIELGQENCCDASMGYAIDRALTEFAQRHLSNGLIESVTYGPQDVTVKTTRQPTVEEQEIMDRLLAHARAAVHRER